MIIDYKTELIHEHTAINCVSEFLAEACNALESSTSSKDIEDFDLPIGVILQCIANSHKLDYIRLAKNSRSKQYQIIKEFDGAFKPRHQKAVALYQSASRDKIIDGLKPHQYIHQYLLNSQEVTSAQTQSAQIVVKHLDEAFDISKQYLSLSKGQRLYRGVSISEKELQKYIDSSEGGQPFVNTNYMSTSLSESIAKAFSALSYLGKLRIEPDVANDLTDIVLVLTNRKEELPFIVPDALKKVNHNQGQMEVLLPRDIQLLPTHFEFDEFNAKIYADIV
ncbi:hypothetical protein D5R81_18750 [Parashewanella spongiae]|uniref:ADP ribosyltransferase domain-containing protein n=1 Tax=Parashewanella spongiae TaxID=342950 RepID=A0A3A6TC76_9GAMM|nr:ADP-ribosyltransferase [Parashewanella spongiae]MCL1080067.1 ADP-ribosyltransferase [Parashewanella spongiae]RJY05104.1 hypothetical protein D5R81_18750 [Parashewanella spongiae]